MLTKSDLEKGFQEVGVAAGDTLLVHSSYKSFGGVDGGPQTVIDALLEVLGEEGTLIMPAFNFDFCKGAPWDVNETPSHMGIITELVRQNPESRRVFHPIYSFSILGKHKDYLSSVTDKSAYGAGSLFAKLRELDGKMLIIGLDYTNSWTFVHHIEEMEGVNYRYMKEFSGEITDAEGNTYQDTFTMLVRDIEMGVVTEVNPMGTLMEKAGVVSVGKIGEAVVKLMKANEAYAFTAREMKRDPYLLYEINEKKAKL
jgi:aminoglycoside 3-N-acetyltransferase